MLSGKVPLTIGKIVKFDDFHKPTEIFHRRDWSDLKINVKHSHYLTSDAHIHQYFYLWYWFHQHDISLKSTRRIPNNSENLKTFHSLAIELELKNFHYIFSLRSSDFGCLQPVQLIGVPLDLEQCCLPLCLHIPETRFRIWVQKALSTFFGRYNLRRVSERHEWFDLVCLTFYVLAHLSDL